MKVEFSDDRRCFWLGTYKTVEEAARAFDVAVWRSGRPRTELNFPKIKTRVDAEFLALKNFWMEERKKKKLAIRVAPGDNDEATMARLTPGRAGVLLEARGRA